MISRLQKTDIFQSFVLVFTITRWNITIYNGTNPSLTRIIAYDADAGIYGMMNYYIGTVNVPYFTINQTTGAILYRTGVSYSTLNSALFPIQFTVFAQDLGRPTQISPVNATVTVYFNNSNTVLPATWLNPASGELNLVISEGFYRMNSRRPLFSNSSGFNGSIIYQLTMQSASLLVVSNPFPSASIPFHETTLTVNNMIYTSGIDVTR